MFSTPQWHFDLLGASKLPKFEMVVVLLSTVTNKEEVKDDTSTPKLLSNIYVGREVEIIV